MSASRTEHTIKNIIFDLGGVIIDIDYAKTSAAFSALGAMNVDAVYSKSKQERLFDEFDVGKITAAEFRTTLKTKLDLIATDDEIDHAFNAMLFNLPKERLDYIKSLRQNFKTFLFSNINEIHIPHIRRVCQEQNGFDSFEGCFDKEYYSCQFGYRKPHASSFLALLQEQGLKPEETLFIDDTIQHVLGAKEAGLHAVHLTGDKTIFNTLDFVKELNKPLVIDQKEDASLCFSLGR